MKMTYLSRIPRIASRKSFFLFIIFLASFQSFASYILLPMDAESQSDHLKAYGITYWTLEKQLKVKWLLNYRGGSFLLPYSEEIIKECTIRGVSFETLSNGKANQILSEISSPSQNQEAVILEKAPKIAVYSPKGNQPWDDAVTMVLTYAEIPYETIYDEEVLADGLLLYDWLHLQILRGSTGNSTVPTEPPLGIFNRKKRQKPWPKDLAIQKFQIKS